MIVARTGRVALFVAATFLIGLFFIFPLYERPSLVPRKSVFDTIRSYLQLVSYYNLAAFGKFVGNQEFAHEYTTLAVQSLPDKVITRTLDKQTHLEIARKLIHGGVIKGAATQYAIALSKDPLDFAVQREAKQAFGSLKVDSGAAAVDVSSLGPRGAEATRMMRHLISSKLDQEEFALWWPTNSVAWDTLRIKKLVFHPGERIQIFLHGTRIRNQQEGFLAMHLDRLDSSGSKTAFRIVNVGRLPVTWAGGEVTSNIEIQLPKQSGTEGTYMLQGVWQDSPELPVSAKDLAKIEIVK
jgi:hypothetical protein